MANIEWYLVALAIAPVMAILWFVYVRTKLKREPITMVGLAFLFGVASAFIAIELYQFIARYLDLDHHNNLLHSFIYCFLVIALVEEGVKFFFLSSIFYPDKHFNRAYDGIVYGVAISMGFAAIENLFYILDNPDIGTSLRIGLSRMFTAVPAHAIFGVMMGYYVGKAKTAKTHKFWYLTYGLILAMVLHGIYDFFLLTENRLGLGIGAVVSLYFGLRLAIRTISSIEN